MMAAHCRQRLINQNIDVIDAIVFIFDACCVSDREPRLITIGKRGIASIFDSSAIVIISALRISICVGIDLLRKCWNR